MSKLQDSITLKWKDALKAKDKLKVSVFSTIRSEIKYESIKRKADLTDDDVLKVIARSVKQHKDSIEQFLRGGREDLVAKERAELEILEGFLPKQLSEAEAAEIIKQVISDIGASGMADMGRVMKESMARLHGRADGKIVSGTVKQLLGE